MRAEEQPPDSPQQKKKKWRPSFWVIVIVSLCGVTFVGFTIYSMNLIQPDNAADKASVQMLVDQFLQYLSVRDVQKAYDLFSTEAKKNTPKSKLEDLITENYTVLFSGYLRNEITSIEISSGLDLSSKAIDNRVAKVSGIIYYEGGATGKYDAYFDRENNSWRIYTINFNIPQLIATPTEKTK
jgi:hypothetical protein